MDARRHASDDRDVVGVGYRGHCTFGCGVEPRLYPAGEGGEDAFREAGREVFGVKAVDADDYGGAGGNEVGFGVEGDCGVD